MTQDDKTRFLHLMISILQNNEGNRLTPALINGIATTLDALTPVESAQERPNG